jgi:hypothetical protein
VNPFRRLKDVFGRDQPEPRLPVMEDQERQPPKLLQPQARPSWQRFAADLGNPWFRVPQDQNLRLYEQLVQTVPVLPRAITALVDLVGVPCVEAEPDVKADIDAWLGQVVTNRIQQGFHCWFPCWLGDMLLYGRSHAELILPQSLDDVFALQNLHPRTIDLRPRGDGYNLDVVQIMSQRGLWRTLNPRLILNAVHDVKTDLPHGHSLLFGLPFIAEIVTSMAKSYKGIWERFGDPSYFINWIPPKEGFADPTGSKAQGFVNGMTNLWSTAMQNRANGDVQDLVYAGDWKVQVVGAQGEALEFTVPYRELTLQVLSKTGIPPFLVGLHDATTETLSTTQAGLLSANVARLRCSVQPQLEYAIRMRQRLAGQPDQFTLSWESPTLVDLLEHARADLFEAQAEAQALRNDEDIWRLGALKPLEFARRHRPDLAGKSDEELAAWLPDLVATPPAPQPPAAFGGNAGNLTGNDGQGNTGGRRSLTYGREKSTNGRH